MRAVSEVQLVLAQAIAGANRVDRHPHLHPVAAGEWQGGAKDLDAQGALAGDRGRGLDAAEAADRPAGEAEGDAEATAGAAREGGYREVALTGADGLDQRTEPRGGRPEVGVA